MRAVHFTNWLEVLEADANLEAPERDSYLITIRWFLGYCKRRGSAATAGEARAFVEEMRGRKHPKQWVEERWKTALNWFFIEAKRYREAKLESCLTSVATNTTNTDEREIAKQEASSNAGRLGNSWSQTELRRQQINNHPTMESRAEAQRRGVF